MRLKGSIRHGGGARKGGMTRTDVRRLLVPNAPEPSPEAVAQPSSTPCVQRNRRFGSPGSIGRRIPGRRRNATWDYASPMLGKERRARSKAAEDCQTGDFAAHRLAKPCSEASPRQPKGRGWARIARQKERGEPKPAPHVQRQAVSPPRRRPSRSCPSCPARERRCRPEPRRPRPRSGAAGSLRSRRPRPGRGWRGCPRS